METVRALADIAVGALDPQKHEVACVLCGLPLRMQREVSRGREVLGDPLGLGAPLVQVPPLEYVALPGRLGKRRDRKRLALGHELRVDLGGGARVERDPMPGRHLRIELHGILDLDGRALIEVLRKRVALVALPPHERDVRRGDCRE